MMFFPTRQIFIQLGPLAIHWYGIMYLIAFLITWWLLPILARKKQIALTKDDVSSILFAGILGTLIGGRLGYVFFYAPAYFLNNPQEIFMVWHGGMSSHGGFIGVIIAILIVLRTFKNRVTFWQLADLLVIPVVIGLACGRFGNFINQELYGPVTNLPWGMLIPGVEGLRHPTPIYAIGKNLLIAGGCTWMLFHQKRTGMTLGLFLTLYGVLRFLIEYVRVETASGFELLGMYFTRGQMLTIPIVVIGLGILYFRRSKKIFNFQRPIFK